MKAFHGDPAVKEKYLARLKAHHAADEIIQGQGWDGSHGCAVGCTLNRYDHAAYENELGLPRWLAHLEDRIFEGLPAKEAQQFAVNFLDSIPVSANVEKVRWLLAAQRHTRDLERLAQNAEPYARQCEAAIRQVIAYCGEQILGSFSGEAARSAARSARSAARSAESAAELAWSAAESAARSAESAARSAAVSAARSARSAAWSAAELAWSAAWSSAESASESAHFQWEAETLLVLLRNAE